MGDCLQEGSVVCKGVALQYTHIKIHYFHPDGVDGWGVRNIETYFFYCMIILVQTPAGVADSLLRFTRHTENLPACGTIFNEKKEKKKGRFTDILTFQVISYVETICNYKCQCCP